jgi:hypothetical protein
MYWVSKKRSGKKFGRRGQFTIFIILGLVIFAAFSFALYARAKIISSQLGQQADSQLKNYLTNNAINQYVISCLDAVTDETILVASMQGGLLNSTDKHEYIDYIVYYNSTLNRTFNVSIAIDANLDCPDNRPRDQYIVTDEAGPYPNRCSNTKLSNLPEIYMTYRGSCGNTCTAYDFRRYSGFFGINKLPTLCNPNGANAVGIVEDRNYYTCEYYSYFEKSMQQLLEEKISQDIDSCVNFTEILKKTPSNITKVGKVNATITFSNRGSFSVNLEYPFTITLRNRQPVTRMIDFSVDREIPFKELYEYTYELANYDVKDSVFDIFNNKDKVISKSLKWLGMNHNLYTSNYIINIIQGDVNDEYINLVQVTDRNHEILGIPLTINFAVRNRRPALEYINDGHVDYDIATTENRTLILSPQGYDPDDEKKLTYTYEGWIEEYNDTYNWSDSKCENPESMEYILANCTKKDLNSLVPQPKGWTKSQLYIDTNQNASYSTIHRDIGLHTVKITVRDRQDKEDFQNVRILVFDLPVAKINGSNLYDDVDNKYASFEDLYILNGSDSTAGVIASAAGARLASFLWNDTAEPFNITKIITDDLLTRVVLIPEDTLYGAEFTIHNIKDKIFNGTEILGGIIRNKDSKLHEISLTVTTNIGLSNANIFILNVTQCLNHSSDTPAYPYDALDPYNIIEDDLTGHLMANHTCCNNNMEYRTSSEECYRAEAYGMNRSFKDYSYPTIKSTPVYNIIYEQNPEIRPYDNAIFKQTFTRACSGDRGNICNGTVIERRDVEHDCDDKNGLTTMQSQYIPAFTNERCSGPDERYKDSNSATTSMPDPMCKNYYTGDTFETIFGDGTATGICTDTAYINTNKLCSNGFVFKAYDDSTSLNYKYTCEGQCLNGECAKPIQDTCKCNIACDSYMPVQCRGLPFGQTWKADIPRQCGAPGTKTWFYDMCNNCALADEDNTCRKASGTNGCTAATACDGIQAGQYPNEVWCASTNPTKIAKCSINNCQLIPVMTDNVCRTSGVRGCTAKINLDCDGTPKNSIIISASINPDGNKWCDNSCDTHNCGSYKSKNNGGCYTTCTDGHECVHGAAACRTIGITKRCV